MPTISRGVTRRAVNATIQLLPDALINKIAAGEVVERPASVVKELLDNALDAGASTVTLEIRDGGRELIRLTDDGRGMSRDDARMALERHATSKIRTADDLFAIDTLGFRGEALPSIASVSRFELTTRTAEDVAGTRVRVHAESPSGTAGSSTGRHEVVVEEIGCAPGTTVQVRDLFFNVPARRKFLKARQTETSHIYDVCLRAALSRHDLRLTVLSHDKRTRGWLPKADWFERAREQFADEGVQRIEGVRGTLQVRAALGAPERARTGTRHLFVFVNGRPVKDRALSRAISFAYGSVMPPGRFPTGVVHLTLPASDVDVNAHPQKTEVRFSGGRTVLDALTRVLASSLGTKAWGGPANRSPAYWEQRLAGPEASGAAMPPGAGAGPARPAATVGDGAPPSRYPPTLPMGAYPEVQESGAGYGAPHQTSVAPAPLLGDAGYFGRLRVLGQMKKIFIVCEGADGMVILDQHAADERVVYHRLRTAFAASAVSTQRLLFPERIDITDADAALMADAADEIRQLGFDLTLLGPRTAAVHAVPTLVHRAPPGRLVRDLLDELSRAGERAYGDAVDMAIATMACHAAIRAGDPLSIPECQALLHAMDEVGEFRGHCPHGRPVVHDVSFRELERRLGR